MQSWKKYTVVLNALILACGLCSRAFASVAASVEIRNGRAVMSSANLTINLQMARNAYPDPDWYPNPEWLPQPDLRPGGSSRATGSLHIAGTFDKRTAQYNISLASIQLTAFRMKGRQFHRVKLTSAPFSFTDLKTGNAVTALAIVNLTDYNSGLFNLRIVRADNAAELFQSGKNYPDPDWMPFAQGGSWISIAPLPSP